MFVKFGYQIVLFQNGSNKMAIELRVAQFWSEIILVISNRTRPTRSLDFEITRMTLEQIALHSDQLPLYISLSLNYVCWMQCPNFPTYYFGISLRASKPVRVLLKPQVLFCRENL